MKKVAKLPIKDRSELFQATAIKMGMQPDVVEKDFWVVFENRGEIKKKLMILVK